MILVELKVPALDKEYDFQLDENAPVKDLIEEITEMICQYEQENINGNEQKFMLCSMEQRCILDMNYGIGVQGIRTGDRLLLV